MFRLFPYAGLGLGGLHRRLRDELARRLSMDAPLSRLELLLCWRHLVCLGGGLPDVLRHLALALVGEALGLKPRGSVSLEPLRYPPRQPLWGLSGSAGLPVLDLPIPPRQPLWRGVSWPAGACILGQLSPPRRSLCQGGSWPAGLCSLARLAPLWFGGVSLPLGVLLWVPRGLPYVVWLLIVGLLLLWFHPCPIGGMGSANLVVGVLPQPRPSL